MLRYLELTDFQAVAGVAFDTQLYNSLPTELGPAFDLDDLQSIMPLELRAQASQAVASSIQVCSALSCDAAIVHSITTDHMADMCSLSDIGFRGRYL